MTRILSVITILFFMSASGQTSKEEFISAGLQKEANKNYSEAIENYNKALSIDSLYIPGFINRSNVYFEQKEYSKALTGVNKVLKLDSNFSIAYNNRGMIYKEQGKLNEAITDYNKAISLDKNYFMAYVNKIRALILLNRLDEAKETVINLKKENPTNSESYLVGYMYCLLTNDLGGAFKELDNAVLIDTKNETALSERAQFKDDYGDEKGAIADYTTLINMNPSIAKYYYGRSSSYFDLKEYDKVIDDCNNAIKLDQNHYAAYMMLGNIYDTYQQTEKAVFNYEKAISIRPNQEEAYNELGGVYYLKDEFSKALEFFNRILAINPNIISSLEHRAACKSKLSDYKGSINDYNKLIALKPNEFNYFYNKGLAEKSDKNIDAACASMKKAKKLAENRLSVEYYGAHNFLFENCRNSFSSKILKVDDLEKEAYNLYGLGKLDLVIKKYDEMIKIVPDSCFLYYNRGKYKRQLEQHEEAILDYKKAVQLDKKNVESWVAMGISYSFLLKLDDAIKAYLEAIKADENYAMTYHNLALIYSEKKEYEKAIQNFEIAIIKDPKYTTAYFQLAINYLKTNNKERACYNFKRAELLGSIPAKIKILSECGN